MFTLRQVVPALCLATSLSGLAVYAATTTPAAPASDSADAPHWHHGHRGGLGAMGYVLHKLNLTAAQTAQINTILADQKSQQKSQFEELRASAKENRHALATTPPTDPNYQTLINTAINTAQHNAAMRISLMSETWKRVYNDVLTKEQQQQIPGIVAAAEAARESKIADWKAQHPQSR